MKNLKQKFQGALIGTFVGDALGMPVEGWPPQAIAQEYSQLREMLASRLGKGTYTDDTQMMLAVAESLVHCQGFNGEDMARRFLDNYDPRRGYGSGTVLALQFLRRGVPWHQTGQKVFGGGSFGNGASMRIAPIGVFYYDNDHALREKAYLSSQITHAHVLGKESAALQAFAVARALLANPLETFEVSSFLSALKAFVAPEASALLSNVEKIESLLKSRSVVEEIVTLLGNDSRGYISVPAAIFAFLSNPHSFEDALVYAVALGGDTDTIAAMTGAIAGAFHGVQQIPQRWLNDLENGAKGKNYVLDLASRLYHIKVNS